MRFPIEWLVCPITKERLEKKGENFVSSAATYPFLETHGVYDFVPYQLFESDQEKWEMWEKLQENGLVSYENDPANNLMVGAREDALSFMEFCNFRGKVLDVGCGPQPAPTHMIYCNNPGVTFAGIDPLPGKNPKEFVFVVGLGEYLPFINELFDQVIFVTSLDHFIDPVKPINEAVRVLKPDGELCIWLGEKDAHALNTSKHNEWYENLEVPAGAEDPFHFRRITGEQLRNTLADLKLEIIKAETQEKEQYKRNLFFKIAKY